MNLPNTKFYGKIGIFCDYEEASEKSMLYDTLLNLVYKTFREIYKKKIEI